MKYKKKCKNPDCNKVFMGTRTQQYCCKECREPTGYYKDKPKKKASLTANTPGSLDEVLKKAKELGMSYGKYVAMQYQNGRKMK